PRAAQGRVVARAGHATAPAVRSAPRSRLRAQTLGTHVRDRADAARGPAADLYALLVVLAVVAARPGAAGGEHLAHTHRQRADDREHEHRTAERFESLPHGASRVLDGHAPGVARTLRASCSATRATRWRQSSPRRPEPARASRSAHGRPVRNR